MTFRRTVPMSAALAVALTLLLVAERVEAHYGAEVTWVVGDVVAGERRHLRARAHGQSRLGNRGGFEAGER